MTFSWISGDEMQAEYQSSIIWTMMSSREFAKSEVFLNIPTQSFWLARGYEITYI